MKLPRLSGKERVILELLTRNGEMYGLEMVKSVPRKIKRGTIYVTLGRMREKGFVTSRAVKKPDMAGLPRQVFSPTGYGARVLRAWDAAESAAAKVLA